MKRAILLLLLISALAGALTQSASGLETANYKYVTVLVEDVSADARSIGLTRDLIQTRVELRLRSAGLTPSKDITKNRVFLYVQVNVQRDTFSTSVEYQRLVESPTGNRRYRYFATTWTSDNTGTHARDTASLMNALDQNLDKFLSAYLKANQK